MADNSAAETPGSPALSPTAAPSPTSPTGGQARPLIAQDELDALMTTLHSVAEASPGRANRPVTVSLFDFRHPVSLLPDQMRLLEAECRSFCRILRRTLVAYLNCDVDFQLVSVGTAGFDQFTRNLAPTPAVGVFSFAPHTSLALWEVTPPLAFAVVEQMLGSPELSPTPAREITPIEAAVLRRFFDELLSTWALTWHRLEGLRLRAHYVTSSLAKIDMRQVEQNVVHVVFQARVNGVEGAMNLGLPVSSLRTLLQRDEAEEAAGLEACRPEVVSSVERIGVGVAVQLPGVRVPLAALQSLRVGEVLPLGLRPDCALVVRVNERAKFAAEGGLADGRLAARITEVLE